MKYYFIILALILSLFMIFHSSCRKEDAAEEKRVFVLFMVDTLRYDSFYNIAQEEFEDSGFAILMQKGTLLSNAFAPSPWTLPSFYSMFTGLSSYKLPSVTQAGPAELDFFTDILRDSGIYTVGIGSSPYFSPFFGFDRHFDYFINVVRGDQKSTKKVAPDTFFTSLADAGQIRQTLTDILENKIPDDRDLFVFIHFIDPHIPYRPIGSNIDDFMHDPELSEFFRSNNLQRLRDISNDFSQKTKDRVKELYNECVRDVDREIGSIINYIEDNFSQHRIMYLFTSDHGEEFWEHDGFEHGHAFYNEVVHIPFLVTDFEIDSSKNIDLTYVPNIVYTFFNINHRELLHHPVIISNNLYGETGLSIVDFPYKFILHRGEYLFDLSSDFNEKDPILDYSLLSFYSEMAERIIKDLDTLEFDQIDDRLMEELKSLGYIQ